MRRTAKTAKKWDISKAFDIYARNLILSQRELIAGDEDAADALCDAMDEVSNDLTAIEIERLSGLSGDLYMLSGRETFLPSDIPLARIDELGETAFRDHDGDTLLHLMRCAGPHSVKGYAAFLRAKAYDFVGYLPAAIEFAREADRLLSDDPAVTAQMLEILLRGNDVEAFRATATKALDRFFRNDDFVVYAASLLFLSYRNSDPIDPSVARSTINYIEPRLSNVTPEFDGTKDLALITLVECYRKLENLDKAYKYVVQFTDINPKNPAAWVGRGGVRLAIKLRDGANDLGNQENNEYISDFEVAIRLKSNDPLPYTMLVYVKHFMGDYKQAIELGRKLDRLVLDDNQRAMVMAIVYEIMAKSSAQIGRIRDAEYYFQRAIGIAPHREETRQSYSEFKRSQEKEPQTVTSIRVLSRRMVEDIMRTSPLLPNLALTSRAAEEYRRSASLVA